MAGVKHSHASSYFIFMITKGALNCQAVSLDSPWWASSYSLVVVIVQSLNRVRLFATPWPAALQASLSFTISLSFLKLMSIESMIPSNQPILCHRLLLSPSIYPSIRVFSNESVLRIRGPKYWSFSFSITPPNKFSGLISFRIDWFHLLTVSRVFSNTTAQKNQFFGSQPSVWSNSHIHTWLLEKP